ncbi:MAG: substrate-binding domain-containing protein [Thermodesulfobacteriota bacterium]
MLLKGKLLVVVCIAAVIGAVSVTCARGEGEKVVKVNGGGMASDVVNHWAEEFMRSRPGISVSVTGTSAAKGFQSLVEGAADLAIMTRDATAEEQKVASEKGMVIGKKTAGYVPVAVVTHPRNSLNELSLEQIVHAFTGRHESWEALGGPDERIRPVSRSVPESGAATFFQTEVLKGKPFARNTAFGPTWRMVLKLCADGAYLSIGILPVSMTASGDIKVLAVKKDQASPAVTPNAENASKKQYPISLPFSLMWDTKKTTQELSDFVEFCARRGIQ